MAASTAPAGSAYAIDGSPAGSFAFYRFYDFRNAPVPEMGVTTGHWSTDTGPAGTLAKNKTTNDNSWTEDWHVEVWDREAAASHLTAINYRRDHIYMSGSPGAAYLTLRTNRLDSSTQEGGQLYFSPVQVTGLTLRISARVQGASGAVAGMFTYHDDTQETDIEVLTKDGDTEVHFTNQPVTDSSGETIQGATVTKTLPNGASSQDFNTYRVDWLTDQTFWYVNGEELHSTGVNVPDQPSSVLINMWSNNGPFAGSMDVGAEATLDIQWIEVAFNTE